MLTMERLLVPLASTSWQTNNAIDIDSTTGDIDITAAGVLTLEHVR